MSIYTTGRPSAASRLYRESPYGVLGQPKSQDRAPMLAQAGHWTSNSLQARMQCAQPVRDWSVPSYRRTNLRGPPPFSETGSGMTTVGAVLVWFFARWWEAFRIGISGSPGVFRRPAALASEDSSSSGDGEGGRYWVFFTTAAALVL